MGLGPQVLGEARRLRQHQAAAVRFKLQKPITKDQEKKKKTSRNKKPRWSWSSWRGALDLLFFKLKWPVHVDDGNGQPENPYRSRQLGHSVSGPLYLAESRNTSKTRHRVASRSGPLAATVPYLCLCPDFRSTVPPPLYLIT